MPFAALIVGQGHWRHSRLWSETKYIILIPDLIIAPSPLSWNHFSFVIIRLHLQYRGESRQPRGLPTPRETPGPRRRGAQRGPMRRVGMRPEPVQEWRSMHRTRGLLRVQLHRGLDRPIVRWEVEPLWPGSWPTTFVLGGVDVCAVTWRVWLSLSTWENRAILRSRWVNVSSKNNLSSCQPDLVDWFHCSPRYFPHGPWGEIKKRIRKHTLSHMRCS